MGKNIFDQEYTRKESTIPAVKKAVLPAVQKVLGAHLDLVVSDLLDDLGLAKETLKMLKVHNNMLDKKVSLMGKANVSKGEESDYYRSLAQLDALMDPDYRKSYKEYLLKVREAAGKRIRSYTSEMNDIDKEIAELKEKIRVMEGRSAHLLRQRTSFQKQIWKDVFDPYTEANSGNGIAPAAQYYKNWDFGGLMTVHPNTLRINREFFLEDINELLKHIEKLDEEERSEE